jgi:uncharacterized membrane protein YdjX (TVP38/TMEM64 family)
MAGTDTEARPPRRARRIKPALVVLAAAVAVWLLGKLPLGPALEWVRAQGVWTPVVFIAIYVVCTVLLIPGSLLTLGAGSIFGPVWGTLYTIIAANLGANLAFLLGRSVAREAIARRVAGNPKFAAIDDAVGREGWKIVGLLRLSPVFPFTLLNYALGLTRIRQLDYTLASLVGMLPGTVMYVYLGSAAGLAAGGATPKTPAEKTLFIAGLVATVAVTVFITRLARKALAAKIEERDKR